LRADCVQLCVSHGFPLVAVDSGGDRAGCGDHRRSGAAAGKEWAATQNSASPARRETADARPELERQRKLRPDDTEVRYQTARAYLMDFYSGPEPEKRRVS